MGVERVVTENFDIWTSAIKAKASHGRGSSKKQEFYGIKKLRQLIMELAVRGKLVQQEPRDEPASEYIKRIAVAKDKLIKDKKIKKIRSLSNGPIKGVFSPLPAQWEWVKLGDLVEMYNGKAFKSSDWGTTGLPIVRIQNLNNEKAEFNYFSGSLPDNNKIDNGSFLISWSGTPGTSFGAFIWARGKAALNQHINKCVFHTDEVNLEFMKLAVNGCMNHFIDMAQGAVGLKHVTMGTLNNAIFGLPPFPEQARIVAKVDELMALCDRLERQSEESIQAHQMLVVTLLKSLINAKDATELSDNWALLSEHFDMLITTDSAVEQLKQTILQLAIMGKLVPQDANDEPASELLKRIAAEKAQLVHDQTIKKQKALPKITKEEQPFALPSGWAWSRIGDSSLYSEYGISAKTFDTENGIPVLKMGDIQSGKVILGGQKRASIDFKGISGLMLNHGDILYNRTNSAELVGKTGRYEGPDNHYSFASYLIRIRCSESNVSSEFLNLNMNAPLFRKTQVEPYLKQQCGQANINGSIMKNMIIAVAPLSEQKRIIDKVHSLTSLLEELKCGIKAAFNTQSILAEASIDQLYLKSAECENLQGSN